MSELKPCPFCGGEVIHAEIYFPLAEFRIYCASGDTPCLAEMRLSFEDAGIIGGRIDFDKAKKIIEEMTETWNRRDGEIGGKDGY